MPTGPIAEMVASVDMPLTFNGDDLVDFPEGVNQDEAVGLGDVQLENNKPSVGIVLLDSKESVP